MTTTSTRGGTPDGFAPQGSRGVDRSNPQILPGLSPTSTPVTLSPESDGADLLLNPQREAALANPTSTAIQPRGYRHRRTTLPRSTRGWSRAIVWSLIGLTGFGVVYGSLARIDSSITAIGKLRPVGGVTSVNTPVNALVQKVLVREGDVVRAGQSLLLFDQAGLLAQQSQLQSQQLLWQKETALLAVQLGLPSAGSAGAVGSRELAIDTSEVELRRRSAQSERERARLSLDQQQSGLTALREKYAINQGIVNRMQTLIANGAMSQLEMDRQQERQVELRSTIERTESELESSRQKVLESDLRERQVPVANLKQLYAQYDSARQQLADVSSRLIEVNEKIRLGRLVAPVSGTVFDLSIKAGETPRPDKPLLQIVPHNHLEVELAISNQDIGHLQPGTPVDVRVNSFPFTEYGSVKATLVRVSADARTANPQNPQEFFVAIAKLKTDQLTKDGRSYPLRAGMAVTGLIQMGTRPALSLISDRFSSFMDSTKSIR